MTWTRLPDTFDNDPRLLKCSRDARLVHVEALVYCNQYLTDGVLPYAALRRLTDSNSPWGSATELETVGLWTPIPGESAWQLDWSEQEPSDRVRRRQVKGKERTTRNRAHREGDHSLCDPRFCRYAVTDAVVNAVGNANVVTNGVGNRTPSRPDPSRPEGVGKGEGDVDAPDNGARVDAPEDHGGARCDICSQTETVHDRHPFDDHEFTPHRPRQTEDTR